MFYKLPSFVSINIKINPAYFATHYNDLANVIKYLKSYVKNEGGDKK